MIKAIIVEDEVRAANMLQIMLEKNNEDVKVLEKCPDLPSGVRSIRKHKPDLVFLDIEMPGHSGLQLMEFFNDDEVTFNIIFTTAFNDYAIRAFELSAIDYILKPIQIEKLNAAVEKFRRNRQKQQDTLQKLTALKLNLDYNERKLAIPVASGIEIVNTADILYFQADRSYCNIILKDSGKMVISKNLKFFEELVSDDPKFFRSHRSYIVNIEHIKKVLRTDGGTLILKNDSELPISSDRVDELINLLS